MQDRGNTPTPLRAGDALIAVDVQNDFIRGGALAVPEGELVVEPLNTAIKKFRAFDLPVFLTRDWHPHNHSSFQEYGGPWPPHCVQDTQGADFVSGLLVNDTTTIITKGVTIEPDEYSGFQGVDEVGNSLDACLKSRGVERIFIGGLATDYCVLNTVLDGLKLGYRIFVFADGIRAVNVKPLDGERALEQMMRNGAKLTKTDVFGAQQ